MGTAAAAKGAGRKCRRGAPKSRWCNGQPPIRRFATAPPTSTSAARLCLRRPLPPPCWCATATAIDSSGCAVAGSSICSNQCGTRLAGMEGESVQQCLCLCLLMLHSPCPAALRGTRQAAMQQHTCKQPKPTNLSNE